MRRKYGAHPGIQKANDGQIAIDPLCQYDLTEFSWDNWIDWNFNIPDNFLEAFKIPHGKLKDGNFRFTESNYGNIGSP